MALISNCIFHDLIGAGFLLIVTIIFYIKWSFRYWKDRNTPYLTPIMPFGNIEPLYNRTLPLGIYMKQIYDEIKAKSLPYAGIYFIVTPMLVLVDLDILKNVLAKDFEYFTDRGFYKNVKDDPLSAHLLGLGGMKWRNLRNKLTPAFTLVKLKAMFYTLLQSGDQLKRNVMDNVRLNEPVAIKDVATGFTIDVIGSCAFGLECNSIKDEQSEFRIVGKKFFSQLMSMNLFYAFTVNFPKLARMLGVRQLQPEVSAFYLKLVRDTVDYRQKNNIERKDFLQLMIEIMNNRLHNPDTLSASSDKTNGITTLTIEEVAAQSLLFFLAGYETSSGLITFTMYELAKHQDIQDRLRNEIVCVLKKHNGVISHDAISEMKYLNQVFEESLRKHPPLPFSRRLCVKDYNIPGTDITIERNTQIFLPIYALHRDEEYYPDAEKFDPERFSIENKHKIPNYAYMPFGEGPRNCIGMRFGLLQSKVGVVILLQNYKYSVNPRTEEPLKMKISSNMLTPDGEIWLDVEEI